MRSTSIFLAASLLKFSWATPVVSHPELQVPLEDLAASSHPQVSSRKLHGKFLHITDLHPDPFYQTHSSTGEDDACHRGEGLAGTYGAETSDCDSPYALINATLNWVKENIKDIDFVVWTGDSARHDSDELIPRKEEEVLSTNRWVAEKFVETFRDPTGLSIPVISTFGNNDILPHNILLSGPNKWLKTYTDIWSNFIPEEQRHGFERGGWYYVEVIPNQLAIFSLNTLYFFSHNAAVDGCALRSEPGYEHLEWLRIQLQFMRERGMKAILIGHVPPARTESKQLWDETCWQKYTLWLRQYRDVVVGGLYGHMNIDHFMLQDTKQVDILTLQGGAPGIRTMMDEELTIESANDYLEELREKWSDLPNPAGAIKKSDDEDEILEPGQKKKKNKKGKGKKHKKPYKKIGGPWGERFQVTLVSPSVVPNFFPTLRVVEYNVSGLENAVTWADTKSFHPPPEIDWLVEDEELDSQDLDTSDQQKDESLDDIKGWESMSKKGKKHKKKLKKPRNPDLTIPSPPSKKTLPGPAYSPQTFTLLGYKQYFANLTRLNNDHPDLPDEDSEDEVDSNKWRAGKYKGKHPKTGKPHPKPFKFQVEYDTFTDRVYKMKDLTVLSYIKLAHRIGQYKPEMGDGIAEILDEGLELDDPTPLSDDNKEVDYDDDDDEEGGEEEVDDNDGGVDLHKKHKHKKHHRQHEKNKVWLRFVKRAFVGTLEAEELRTFDEVPQPEAWAGVDSHDGEL